MNSKRFSTKNLSKLQFFNFSKNYCKDKSSCKSLYGLACNILCKKDVSITGDYSWEIEALKNIIKNAIDASLDNSNIDILVKENNFYVSIIIKDYGKGIEKEELKHIFERFYKLNDDSNSFGIGLSLAKMIIESDGGMIDVESKIKEGTTFTIKYMK